MEKELYYKQNKNTNDSSHWLIFHIWKFVEKYLFRTSPNCFKHWRIFLLRLFGAKIGKNCYIASTVTIKRPWLLKMGNFSSIDEYSFLSPPISIGDYCSLASHSSFIAGGHDVRSRSFELTMKPITLGNGCFLGASSFVGGGVTIGQFSVLGANSSTFKDIPENSIAVGNPARVISSRIPYEGYNKYRYDYDRK